MLKKFIPILICLTLLFLFITPLNRFSLSIKTNAAENPNNSVLMADNFIAKNPTQTWCYDAATVLKSLQMLYEKTNNLKYYNYIKKIIDDLVNEDGNISGYRLSEYNLDQITMGKLCLFLYQQTSAPKYKLAAENLRQQLETQPRTSDGGFWHKEIYPDQMWLDGLYMATPFYIEYGKTFNDTSCYDDGVNQLILMYSHAKDPETGLLYHGWDAKKIQNWANKTTGCSSSFWGRSIGWYMMALVDTLDYLPTNHKNRNDLINILRNLSAAIVKYQDSSTGTWYQVVDQGDKIGNYLESSSSCMFVYALSKASRKSYIDSDYLAAAQKGYKGILNQFITKNSSNIILNSTSNSAGLSSNRNGSFEYYTNVKKVNNDRRGIGPFIMASIEIETLRQN